MENSFQVTATIVAYKNDVDELLLAINSFLNTKLSVRIYIIDNSPTDYLRKYLSYDNRIEYHFLNENNGFGAGHNKILGVPSKMGKYHLVLNPDIQFNTNTIEALYEYMERNSNVGNVMPKVVYPDGNLQYLCKLLPTPLDWIGRLIIPFDFIKKHINNNFEMRFADYNQEMNVPYLSGCFMFLRKRVIEEIGLFDTGIFMYGEDTDLNRRIYQRYQTMYYPEVTIIHRHEKGSHKNFKLMWIHIKAAIYYFNKWGWFFDSERKEINKKSKHMYTNK